MLKIEIKKKISCSKHPRYDPTKDGENGIRGSCSKCYILWNFNKDVIFFKMKMNETEHNIIQ